jgi:hypothetical protein
VKVECSSTNAMWPRIFRYDRYYVLVLVLCCAIAVADTAFNPVFVSCASINVHTKSEYRSTPMYVESSERCIAAQREVMRSEIVLNTALRGIRTNSRLRSLTIDNVIDNLRITRDPFRSLFTLSISGSNRRDPRIVLSAIVSAYVDHYGPYERAYFASANIKGQEFFCQLIFADVKDDAAQAYQRNNLVRNIALAFGSSIFISLFMTYIVALTSGYRIS